MITRIIRVPRECVIPKRRKFIPRTLLQYTLPCTNATFTLSGISNNLLYGRLISLTKGTFTETGTNNNLLYGRLFSVSNGTFTLSGTSNNLLYGRLLNIGKGTFTKIGINNNLLYGRLSSVSNGAFTLTGKDNSWIHHRLLEVSRGTFTETGNDINLLVDRLLACTTRTYELIGKDAILTPAGDDVMIICIDPGIGNVRSGTTYKITNVDFVGTLTLPVPPDVRAGVFYGASGIEYCGSLIVHPGSNVVRHSNREFYDLIMTEGKPIDFYYDVAKVTDPDTGETSTTKTCLPIRRVVISSLNSKYKFELEHGTYQKDDLVILVDIKDLSHYVQNKEDYFVWKGKKYSIVTWELIDNEGHIFIVRHVQNEAPGQERIINIRHGFIFGQNEVRT